MMGESVRAKRGGRLRVMESGCKGGGGSADWLVDAVADLICLLDCVCVVCPPPEFSFTAVAAGCACCMFDILSQ